MLKSELHLSIHKKYPSLKLSDIEYISQLFFKKIIVSLNEGKNVELRGFGTFTRKKNKAKYVRNPKTNERFYKQESNKMHFKIGKILHNRINLK